MDKETQKSEACKEERHDDCPGYEIDDELPYNCYCECHEKKASAALPVQRPR